MFLEYKLNPEYLFPLLADNLFCDLTPKTRASFNRIKRTKQFLKGESLFSASDSPCGISVLREGQAKLSLNYKSLDMLIVRPVETGELLGLTDAIADLPYKLEVRTTTNCIFECVRREDFIRFIHDEPEVCFRLLQMLAESLQKSYKIFLQIIEKNVISITELPSLKT